MKIFHGTTTAKFRSILENGLRQGSYVTTEPSVAKGYAIERSIHGEGMNPIVIEYDVPSEYIHFFTRVGGTTTKPIHMRPHVLAVVNRQFTLSGFRHLR